MKAPKMLQVQIAEKYTDSFWSWIVCICSFSLQLLVGGLHCSFGTFFVALLDKFGRSEAETAWVGSLAIGITYFCGPLSTYLCHRFGCRIVACTGSILLAISGFWTSVATSIVYMYFTFGVLNGLASSLLYFSSLVVLIEYFHKHLSLANGIALSGLGVGTLSINMLSQYLISKYGLTITFKVVAGFSAITFLAGLAYSPLKKKGEQPEKLKKNLQKEENIPVQKSSSFASKCERFCRPGKQWKNKGFLLWTVAMALILFAYYIPCMYLLKIAQDVGVPASKGSLLVGLMYVSQSIGKIICGRLADLRSANRLLMAQLSLLVIAVAGCLLPLARSYTALFTYAIIQGFFDGSFVVLFGLITHDIVGKALMADAVGSICSVISIPMTVGPPVAGMFYDFLGNYNAVFFLCSGLICVGICITFLVPWLTPPALAQLDYDKQVLLSIENDLDKCHEDDKEYDMSYVDEKKLADLFSKKHGINHLLERNRSQLDFGAASRPSSFVLFTIVSDEHPHDISAYTSRQELAFISGTTTPLRGTPGTVRRRYNDIESYTSMYSLRQSVAEVIHAHPEVGTPVNTECTDNIAVPLIHRDIALETVEEVNEGERKTFREENKPSAINIILETVEEAKEEKRTVLAEEHSSQKDIGIAEVKELSNKEGENSAAQGEDRGSSWCLSDSDDSWKSSSQSTTGTIDSGYVEYTDTSSSSEGKFSVWDDTNTHYSADNLNDNENAAERTKDLVYHSYSCNNITELPELKFISANPQKTSWEANSVELIDNHWYEEPVDNPSLHCDHKNELITYSELPQNKTEEPRCEKEIIPDDGFVYSTKTDLKERNISIEDVNADEKEKICVENSTSDDIFSLMVEGVLDDLEFEMGGAEYVNSYGITNPFNRGYSYRETVV